MNWENKDEVKKGDLGEMAVKKYLESQGFIVYKPETDGAHAFDILCVHRNKKSMFIADVKTKPHRLHYPDTGIDIRHYKEYTYIGNKYNMDVILFFVDEEEQTIRAGKFGYIDSELEIIHNNKPIHYPLEAGGIIYFPLKSLKVIDNLSDIYSDSIKQYSTRNGAYVYGN